MSSEHTNGQFRLPVLRNDMTVDELRSAVSAVLGVESPIHESVAYAIVNDPLYAHHLMVCRDAPEFLGHLLENPPPLQARPEEGVVGHSPIELGRRVAQSIWKWALSGFREVDDATYRKRIDACLACPHCVDAPKQLIYRLASGGRQDSKICDICGCVVTNKARLPGESCPEEHGDHRGLNRWGEPHTDVVQDKKNGEPT